MNAFREGVDTWCRASEMPFQVVKQLVRNNFAVQIDLAFDVTAKEVKDSLLGFCAFTVLREELLRSYLMCHCLLTGTWGTKTALMTLPNGVSDFSFLC